MVTSVLSFQLVLSVIVKRLKFYIITREQRTVNRKYLVRNLITFEIKTNVITKSPPSHSIYVRAYIDSDFQSLPTKFPSRTKGILKKCQV